MNKLILVLSLIIFFSLLFKLSKAQTNQTVSNGESTSPVNFQGTGCIYNWVNNTPEIGLPASGTGNIPSFKASNNGSNPVVATVTATPVSVGFAYITNYQSNTVSVINTSNNSVVATIQVGTAPWGVAVSQDGNRVYVANSYDGTVSVINTADNTVLATITAGGLGSSSITLAVSPDGNRLYVMNHAPNTVTVINTANNAVIATFRSGTNSGCGIVVSPDGTKLYLAGTNENSVFVFNTANYSLITKMTTTYPRGIAISPDGNKLYVTNYNTISVFNTVTYVKIATVPVGVEPLGIAVSPNGNSVYVANQNSNSVSVIDAVTNKVYTINGVLTPSGVSVSPDGTLAYVANYSQNAVSVINTVTNSVITTIPVGSVAVAFGNFISAGPGCNSTPLTFTITVNNSTPINPPPNITYQTPQTYKVNTAITPLVPKNTGGAVPANAYGKVTTLAGTGQQGFIDGPGVSATFTFPENLSLDINGNIYTANNNKIRKITPGGIVSTIAGSGAIGYVNGTGAAASFGDPAGIAIDIAGNLYVADDDNCVIRKVTQAGVVTTFAGKGNGFGYSDGSAAQAMFSRPYGITIDLSGNLYVTDQNNFMIRKITPNGDVTTLAGSGSFGFANGTGVNASFGYLSGIVIDKAGNLYVADEGNNMIRKITQSGVVTTFAGTGVAGNTDGPILAASFQTPAGLTIDNLGNFYVGDHNNLVIRKITPNGIVSTLPVMFGASVGVAVTQLGDLLYFADVPGNSIKEVILTGYTIDKPLPVGLSFDPTTGIISGTPTALSAAADYSITAYNLGGSSTTVVNIAVSSLSPVIISGTATGTITACAGSPSSSPNILQLPVSGSNLTSNVTATAPTGFEVSLSAGSGFGDNVIIAQTGGAVNSTIIFVRSSATASGNISGNVLLSSTGAPSQNIAVTGIVNALPTVNSVTNQIVTAANKTNAINFTGSSGAYNWTNNTPGIGLPANGTGNIASFTAVNTGTTPITATISVTPTPSALAYIANYDSNDVSVISTVTNTVIKTFPVGSNPFGVSVSQDGNLVYITNKGSNSVSVINTSTNTVTATINVGGGPQGIIVSPDGTRVYVANSIDNSISVINTANNTVLATIPVGQAPYGVTITPDGSTVYVANYSSNTVSVINSSLASVIATISGFTNPLGVAVSPDGNKLFVSNFGSNAIKIVNTTSNTITTSIQTMLGPTGLVVSPDGSKVYVATSGGYFTTVFLSDNTTNSVAFDSGRSISVTPDGSYVYIANGYNVDWVSSSNYTNGGQIAVGTHPISFGNFISKGPGCSGSPITFTITVNPPPPTITAGNATGNISACAGSASSSPNIQQFTVSGSGLSANITATTPPGFEISLAAASGYSSSVKIPQSGGAANNTVVYVRSAASASGSLSGNVVLSSPGATNQDVAVKGTVNALPIVNAVANQTVNNGAATTAINFAGTGSTFNWTNDLPAIGLPSGGTGSIPSFTAVNTGNNPVTATITVIPDSQISGFAYAANFGSNSVSVINTATNKVVANVTVGSNPNNAAVTPDGKQVYVTNPNSYNVSVINTATNTVTTTIPVGVIPFDVVISPDNKYAYVVNQGSNSVSVINTSTNAVIFTIPVGFDPYHIAISPDGSNLYVTYGQNGSTLSVINTATYAIIADIPIGFNFYGVTANPDGKTVYVGNHLTGEISVISTSTNSVVTTFSINGSAWGLVVSPDGSRLYIANESQGTVTVVNTATNTVLSDINGSEGPYGISISPDGSMVYVTNPGGADVTVINTATNTLVSRIDVGQLPESFNNFVSGTSGCSGTPVTFTITVNPTLPPKIVATGSLSTLTTTYGTPSPSTSFSISGTDMTAGILVTPPPGFEVSTDNITFSSTVTVGAAGTISSTTVYVRLKSTMPVGSYSGDIVLSSTNAANVNVATASSTVNPAPLTITVNNVTKTYGAALNSGAGSTAFTSTGLKNNETIGSITVTYGPGAAANATAITYTGSVTGSAATGGTFTAGNYTITYLPGDIIVNPAQLIITANDQTITFGEPIPALTVTYNSFVNGENVTQLTTPPVITTTATSSSAPGTYTIEVNGATSPNYTITQIAGTLTIKPFNPPIVIPNTFTPNGDGINDVWNIKSLSDYPDCSVSIYTRYGSLIYQSHGYPKPWDGTYKGSALPTGTYYYIINLQNGNEPQSGPVTIIR